MSVEQITKKIKSDADEKASTIRVEAENRKEIIEQETAQKKETLQKEADDNLKKQKVHERSVFLSAAKQAGNIARQEVKYELATAMLKEVYASLLKLPDDEYIEFFINCLQLENISTDSITSVVAPEDRKEATEKILKKSGITAPVSYETDLSAGIQLLGDNVVVDLSMDRLFMEATDDLLQKVTKDLFN